jgi:hypothetical protein
MTRSTVKRVGITVLCGLIALEVDLWRQTSTAPLLLGRIITLPIAILFGPWYGALAAVIHAVSGRGIFAAGLRILPLEAIVIGLFARRGRSPMLGGLIVWTAVSGTLIAVPSFYGVGYLRDTILPVALQLVVSGLMAVAVADLIASAAFVQRLVGADQQAARHLRADAFHAFVLAATVPVLVLASVDGQLSSAKQEEDGGGRLHEAVTALSQHISAYVNDHEHAVQSLAAALTSLPADGQRRQALLGRYHDVYPGFLTIFAADRLGIVREIFPPRDTEPPPLSDREYFMDAVRTRQLAVSEVILGRLSYVPIITIAVPIFDAAGAVSGVAAGSLDLSKFDKFVEDFRSLPNARITVLDQHSRVIFTSGETTFTALQSLAADDLVLASAEAPGGVFRYARPIANANESTRLAATAIMAPTGWRVFVEQPLAYDDVEGLKKLARGAKVPIGVDEGIHSFADITTSAKAGAGGVSLKLIKLGGIIAAIEAGKLCRRLGLSVNIAAKIAESSISSAAALHLACAVPKADWGVSLTHFYLAEDIVRQPLPLKGGLVARPAGPGLGIEVEEAAVERFRVR